MYDAAAIQRGTAFRVLVCEGDYILGSLIGGELERYGHEILGPCCDARSAAEHLHEADAGILNVVLQEEFSFFIADKLCELGKPFLFLINRGSFVVPDHLRFAPVIEPADITSIGKRVSEWTSGPQHEVDSSTNVVALVPLLRYEARLLCGCQAFADGLVERALRRAINTFSCRDAEIPLRIWLMEIMYAEWAFRPGSPPRK